MPALLLLPALALAAPRANSTALVAKAQCPSAYGPGKHTINLDVTQCDSHSLFCILLCVGCSRSGFPSGSGSGSPAPPPAQLRLRLRPHPQPTH